MDKLPYAYGRVQVIAIRDKINDELERGHTLSSIYIRHKQQVKISYSAFYKLVNKYVVPPKSKPTNEKENINRARSTHRGDADPATLRRLVKGY